MVLVAHYLVRCQIPCFIHITDGLCRDVNVLDILEFESGAFYANSAGNLTSGTA